MDTLCQCMCLPPVCKHALMCIGTFTPCGCVRVGLANRQMVKFESAHDRDIPEDETRACPCIVGCLCCPLVIPQHNRFWSNIRDKIEDQAADDEFVHDGCACGYPWFCCQNTSCWSSARCCPCSIMGYPCGWSEIFGLQHLDLDIFSPRRAPETPKGVEKPDSP